VIAEAQRGWLLVCASDPNSKVQRQVVATQRPRRLIALAGLMCWLHTKLDRCLKLAGLARNRNPAKVTRCSAGLQDTPCRRLRPRCRRSNPLRLAQPSTITTLFLLLP
jgi:hypothetical protein